MLRFLVRPGVLLALGLLFGLGAGAWAMRLYFDRTLSSWDPSQRFLMTLDQDLGLNQEQREKVAIILSEQRARMEARRQTWRLEVRTLGREGEDQIARILDPHQTQIFMKKHDEIHGRMDRFMWATDAGPSAVAVGPVGR